MQILLSFNLSDTFRSICCYRIKITLGSLVSHVTYDVCNHAPQSQWNGRISKLFKSSYLYDMHGAYCLREGKLWICSNSDWWREMVNMREGDRTFIVLKCTELREAWRREDGRRVAYPITHGHNYWGLGDGATIVSMRWLKKLVYGKRIERREGGGGSGPGELLVDLLMDGDAAACHYGTWVTYVQYVWNGDGLLDRVTWEFKQYE